MKNLERARLSLEGLSVGDALGGYFEFETVDWEKPKRAALKRDLPPPTWGYTDDTQMALSIYEQLRLHGTIDSGQLAKSFADHFDIMRGYGIGAEKLLDDIRKGGNWQILASDMFNGTGSYGNGAAMRVAPLGAYFADDVEQVIVQAKNSSLPTHTNSEGVAGAIAVAVASAIAGQLPRKPTTQEFIEIILSFVPQGIVQRKLYHALNMPEDMDVHEAAKQLGCGWDVSAMDTVPFALWMAARHMDNFEEAIWQTISAGGDVDTTCAMVGGIVACFVGYEGIPQEWIEHREALPAWALG